MKAVILAAGDGTRLGEPKASAVVSGKPLIEYSMEYAKAAGIPDILVVTKEIQPQPLGIADAMRCAKDFLDGDDFLLLLVDEIYIGPRHREMVYWFQEREDVFGLCGMLRVDDEERIRKNYSIETVDGRIIRTIEKPKIVTNNYLGVGSCVFSNKILDYEGKDLPELIQNAIEDGKTLLPFTICDAYFNINTVQDKEQAEEASNHGS